MTDPATVATAAMTGASAAICGCDSGIDGKTILGWSLTLGSVDFGVLGFLYSIYASAQFTGRHKMRIITILRHICTAMAASILTLALLAIYTAYEMAATASLRIILLCFTITAGYAVYLVFKMYTPEPPTIQKL